MMIRVLIMSKPVNSLWFVHGYDPKNVCFEKGSMRTKDIYPVYFYEEKDAVAYRNTLAKTNPLLVYLHGKVLGRVTPDIQLNEEVLE